MAGSSWIERWRSQAPEELAARFARQGADDPLGWAESELRGDIPQMARYLFLRGLWSAMDSAVEQAVAAAPTGADPAAVARSVAYDLAFSVLVLLDDPDVADDLPRWSLVEVGPGGERTGRLVDGLHESLQETDPEGRDAASWIEALPNSAAAHAAELLRELLERRAPEVGP